MYVYAERNELCSFDGSCILMETYGFYVWSCMHDFDKWGEDDCWGRWWISPKLHGKRVLMFWRQLELQSPRTPLVTQDAEIHWNVAAPASSPSQKSTCTPLSSVCQWQSRFREGLRENRYRALWKRNAEFHQKNTILYRQAQRWKQTKQMKSYMRT